MTTGSTSWTKHVVFGFVALLTLAAVITFGFWVARSSLQQQEGKPATGVNNPIHNKFRYFGRVSESTQPHPTQKANVILKADDNYNTTVINNTFKQHNITSEHVLRIQNNDNLHQGTKSRTTGTRPATAPVKPLPWPRVKEAGGLLSNNRRNQPLPPIRDNLQPTFADIAHLGFGMFVADRLNHLNLLPAEAGRPR